MAGPRPPTGVPFLPPSTVADRAFAQNVDRLVRRTTIVNSADDIRRNITLCLVGGRPCTLEMGSNIASTSGYIIPGGLKAFSLDGAQRFKIIVSGDLPWLFRVECLDVEVGNLEAVVKNGSTLTSVFDVDQPSNIYPSLKVSNARFTGITEDNPIAIDSLFSQQANAGITRQAVVDVSKIIVEGVQRLVAVDDVQASWLTSTFRDMRLSRVGGFGSLPDVLIGGGALSSGFIGCVFENISGRFSVDLGETSDASSFSNLLVLGAGAIPTFRTNPAFPGQAVTLKRVEFMLRALSPDDVDLDNIVGGGGVADGTYGDVTVTGGGTVWTVTRPQVKAASIGVPFGLQEQTVTIVDASCTVASNVIVGWGATLPTDENQPGACAVTFSAVPAAGSLDVTVSSDNADPVGGTYKILYTLG
jgi:hypothetical protein